MDIDLIEVIVTNAPNFIGFAILGLIQWRDKQQLLDLLRDCLDDEDDGN